MFITNLKFQILACAILCNVLWNPEVHAKDTPLNGESISWVLLNFPPMMKLEIDREGEMDIGHASGPMAELQKELVKALPQYKHLYKVVTYPRAKKLFESHGGYCTIMFLRNADRSQYLYFGETIATATPPGLVTNKKNEALLKITEQNQFVDLEQLLKKENFQLGVVSGRSFSPRIDAAFVNTKKPVFKMVIYEAMGSLFKMLNAQRVDGVLAYYMELAEEQERNPAASDLRFYQLKQDHVSISLPVSCEKSPWGKKTLEQISIAVKDEAVKQKLSALIKQTLLIDRPKHSEEPGTLLR
jgi:uncharacterized protein (TIGR02285 family)